MAITNKRKIWLPDFVPGEEFVAKKAMTVSGRRFLPGQVFDKTLVTTRQLRRMYDTRMILSRVARMADTPGDRRRARTPSPRVVIDDPRANEVEVQDGLSMEMESRGNWFVLRNGQRFAGPMRKTEATARLEELRGD